MSVLACGRSGTRVWCSSTGNPHAVSCSSRSRCVATGSFWPGASTWKQKIRRPRLRVILGSSWRTVPAGGADDKQPLLIGETHRGAVDLHFERIPGGADLRDQPGVAILPFGELRLVEGVGERQHRHQVAVLLERRRGLRADALRGAVGGAELGMFGLELLQLAKQAVVLGVGHLRLVEYVVSVVGALDEPPQLGGSCGKTLHRPLASS